MIQLHPENLIALKSKDEYYYAIVVTKILLFGGNLLFGFYRSSNALLDQEDLLSGNTAGFLAFADLLGAKKENLIEIIGKGVLIESAIDPKRYKQTNSNKESDGYLIRIWDDNHNFLEEHPFSDKNEIPDSILQLPEFRCTGYDFFFKCISHQWHQSKIEDLYLNGKKPPIWPL